MLAITEITGGHYAGFILVILFFLALDLGVFHKEARVVRFKEALGWTAVWFTLSMAFSGYVYHLRGREEALQYITGYIIELSLSMDNVFVIALIFAYFRVPLAYQHRVLFWGILGALVMRGVMIGVGAALIKTFAWTLYVFGAFLVFTGIKMMFGDDEGVEPEKNPIIRLVRKFYPVAKEFDGQKFTTEIDGKKILTPLALVLVMVETTDLIFAVDSIPAIFAITDKPFIVFTSNVFAILGLRSLYFVLADAIGMFRYLKVGLSVVLVFIGVKMLADPHGKTPEWYQFKIPITISLGVIAGIIIGSILLSLLVSKKEGKLPPDDQKPGAQPSAETDEAAGKDKGSGPK
ncbi:MAG TPA: TerC family protein [Verrucomicrobiae bacterium]